MKEKRVFFCTDCGNEFPKWSGQCPACGSWNTIVEQTARKDDRRPAAAKPGRVKRPVTLKDVDVTGEVRFGTGIGELDRVLGGGAVLGLWAVPPASASPRFCSRFVSLLAGSTIYYMSPARNLSAS